MTVDTSVAHLAAALGAPCWILLPQFQTDWRRMRGRTDSPWYDSARPYRQHRMGDWGGVAEQVLRDAAYCKRPASRRGWWVRLRSR